MDDKETDDIEEVEVKKTGSSTIKIVVIAVLMTVLLGGGLVGATFYFVNSMNADEHDVENKNTSANKTKEITKNEDDENTDDDDEQDADIDETEGEDEDEDVSIDPPQYHSMDPKFVVSFSDQKNARFMQFSIEIMSRKKSPFAKVQLHQSAIRSSLLMLFGGQDSKIMSTRKGKQQLLDDAVKDINATLVRVTGDKSLASAIEAAYFNSFVIQ